MTTPPPAGEQKVVWPVFLVAALSFVPFIGIFFGCAAATWGLVSSRPRAIWAAPIGIAGALANIVTAVLLTVSGFGGSNAAIDAKFIQGDMLRTVAAIEDYHAREQTYPPSLSVLRQRLLFKRTVPTLDLSGRGVHVPHDYRYVVAPDNQSYDLVATGPDNVFCTADDIRPVVPDSVSHGGFRPIPCGAHQ